MYGMSPRPVAEARISFGLVSIPVELYTATQAHAGLSFNMLHGKCGTRVKQQLYCPTCEEKIERGDTVKGYEFEKNQYVQLSADELKALEEESTQLIEIEEFLPLTAVDPVYFDKAYYLGTAKHGEKAYNLLAEALIRSERAAIGNYAARGRSHLVLIRPRGTKPEDGLVLQELLYADEVRDMADVPRADAELREQEVKLALQVIDQAAHETFDPSKYKDERREQIQKLIDDKVAGQTIRRAPQAAAAPPADNVLDLVAVLEASLKKKTNGPGKPAKRAGAEPVPMKKKKAKS
jgi:DNA end-binding protein Ku